MEKLRGPAPALGAGACAAVVWSSLASAASRRSRSGISGTDGSVGGGEASGCEKASSEDWASSFSFLLLRRTPDGQRRGFFNTPPLIQDGAGFGLWMASTVATRPSMPKVQEVSGK